LFIQPGERSPGMGTRVLSALASGAIGITVANVSTWRMVVVG
jgi:hypothetical protein